MLPLVPRMLLLLPLALLLVLYFLILEKLDLGVYVQYGIRSHLLWRHRGNGDACSDRDRRSTACLCRRHAGARHGGVQLRISGGSTHRSTREFACSKVKLERIRQVSHATHVEKLLEVVIVRSKHVRIVTAPSPTTAANTGSCRRPVHYDHPRTLPSWGCRGPPVRAKCRSR